MPFASCVGVEYECTAVGIRDEEVLLKQESKFTTRDPIFDEENLYCLKLYEKNFKRLLYYFLSKILSDIIAKSTIARYLKITEKVSFDIASEAS